MMDGAWDKIRVVQYGCGKMGRIIMRYLLDQGAQIVGAIDCDDELVDKDIGEVIGLDRATGIKIKRHHETVLDNCDADIAVLALQSFLPDMHKPILDCVTRGINVITTAEEALYPFRENGQWGYMNRLGETVIPPQWADAAPFSETAPSFIS